MTFEFATPHRRRVCLDPGNPTGPGTISELS